MDDTSSWDGGDEEEVLLEQLTSDSLLKLAQSYHLGVTWKTKRGDLIELLRNSARPGDVQQMMEQQRLKKTESLRVNKEKREERKRQRVEKNLTTMTQFEVGDQVTWVCSGKPVFGRIQLLLNGKASIHKVFTTTSAPTDSVNTFIIDVLPMWDTIMRKNVHVDCSKLVQYDEERTYSYVIHKVK